ncbi:MAG: TadE/TadG family type IV pilus assembly protein [Pirellulaceae bacterium]|nr:TadE/TadG family type IV pilus assembly protein [Pirellulaceae bacterium]
MMREGIACVEFAVLAPVLVLITLSIIDICNVIHLKQKVSTVAFETARTASFDNETYDNARLEGLRFSAARGLKNPIIAVESFDRTNYPTRASLPLGFTLHAQVEVPVTGNVPGPFLLFRGSSIKSQLAKGVA